MVIKHIYDRFRWWKSTDRVGPDIPLTHVLFYFPDLARRFCEKKFAHFGKGAEIRPGATVVGCSRVSIGANVIIRPGSFLGADPGHAAGTITIEDEVLMSPGVIIYTTDHDFTDPTRLISAQGDRPALPVHIKKGSWIGVNSVLLPGVTIGLNCVIGAGSIVTKDVPDFCVAVGNPARVVRKITVSETVKTNA